MSYIGVECEIAFELDQILIRLYATGPKFIWSDLHTKRLNYIQYLLKQDIIPM